MSCNQKLHCLCLCRSSFYGVECIPAQCGVPARAPSYISCHRRRNPAFVLFLDDDVKLTQKSLTVTVFGVFVDSNLLADTSFCLFSFMSGSKRYQVVEVKDIKHRGIENMVVGSSGATMGGRH